MRVNMLEVFEAYVEGTVIAIIAPEVRISLYIAERTFFLQLLEDERESTPDALLTHELVCTAKRTRYE